MRLDDGDWLRKPAKSNWCFGSKGGITADDLLWLRFYAAAGARNNVAYRPPVFLSVRILAALSSNVVVSALHGSCLVVHSTCCDGVSFYDWTVKLQTPASARESKMDSDARRAVLSE